MVTSPIADDLDSDLKTGDPEKYVKDLHKEMQNLKQRISKEMDIETEAAKMDEELESDLENMLNLYTRYENALIAFVTFLKNEPEDEDEMVKMARFSREVYEGDLEVEEDPAELPQVMRTIEEDFKKVFERLKEKDEELKEIVEQDYNIEEEIEIVEKMAKNLEKLTTEYEEARNN